MNRLRKVALFILPALWLAVAPFLAAPAFANPAGWQAFRQRFIAPEGRLVDTDQGGVSHSEGQGYAMLLAVNYGDRATFEQLWRWTRQNLQVRGDKLLAWRWTPKDGVTDKNNASDGDLLVAWALLRAYKKWHAPEFLADSRGMAADIRTKLVQQTDHGTILLPAAEGFSKRDGDAINLSYWVFPALDEIGEADPSPQWKALADNGIAILKYAHFGRWGLPPDWLTLKTTSVPDDGLSDRFSYNALRIPLYLLWSRRETPALLQPYRDFWNYFDGARFLPAWTDLKDNCVDSYNASLGIRRLALWVTEYPQTPAPLSGTPEQTEGYYSSALLLLSEMAMQERQAAGARQP
jgi:endo-1,4-beta-D-glucanase Y